MLACAVGYNINNTATSNSNNNNNTINYGMKIG